MNIIQRIKNLWWYGRWTACKHTNATYHGWRNYMACPDCKIGAWKGMKMSDLDRSNFE
jgi:hypothetical protein